MHRVSIALAAGLLLTLIAVGVTVSHPPLVVAGTNSTPTKEYVELFRGDVSDCQPAGTLPRGTTAVRLAFETIAVGPRVGIKLMAGSRVVTAGERAAGWGVAQSVIVPVGRVSRTARGVRLCMSIGPTVEPFRARGVLVHPGATGAPLLQEVRLGAEYLRPGGGSWLSLASSVAHHMGVGNASGGSWIAFFLLALMLVISALVSWATLKEIR